MIHILFLVIDYSDILDAHRLDLCHDTRRVQIAFVMLATCHRNGIVIKDLVGDVRLGRDGRTDRQIARMVVCSVTEVLEHMLAGREFGFTDPVRPFPPHMGKARCLAVHPLHHIVTTDPGVGAAPLW